LLQRLASPHPELVRKLMHVGMGLVTFSFPWIFDEAWPVIVLACVSIGVLLSLRLVASLKESLGSVLAAAGRAWSGEGYFPLAVAILYVLYQREPATTPADRRLMLYCIPILLLTVADATAALIGTRYGRWHYETADGEKSAEGSLGFFASGFFSVHVPLL